MRDIAAKIHNETGRKQNGDESLAGKVDNDDEALATLKKQTMDMLKYICKTLSLGEIGSRTDVTGQCLQYIDGNESGLATVQDIIANRTLTAPKANKTTISSQTATKILGADTDVSYLTLPQHPKKFKATPLQRQPPTKQTEV